MGFNSEFKGLRGEKKERSKKKQQDEGTDDEDIENGTTVKLTFS